MEEKNVEINFFETVNGFKLAKNIIGEYSPLSLAFIGDAIFEVYVRTYILSKGNTTPHKLHLMSASYVKAKSQARIMQEIQEYLNEDEVEIAKRGRNAKSGSIPKNADITDYRNATGLESLFGYLYLSNKIERLEELLKISIKIMG